MSERITFICLKCGSFDITRDAIVAWSVPEQRWEVVNVLDNGDCNRCGNSGNNVEAEIPASEESAARDVDVVATGGAEDGLCIRCCRSFNVGQGYIRRFDPAHLSFPRHYHLHCL